MVSVAGARMPHMTPTRLLAFEAKHPAHVPSKTQTIRRELGIGPARYYQLLLRAASSAEGIAADPITARRVREHPVQATRRVMAAGPLDSFESQGSSIRA